MKTKGIIILLLVLGIILSGCKPQTGTTTPTTGGESTTTPGTGEGEQSKSLVFEIDYCTSFVKAAQLSLDAAERKVEKETLDLKEAQDELAESQAAGDQDDVQEDTEKLEAAEKALDDAKESVKEAQDKFNDINQKCEKLSKKADKSTCNEFKSDLQNKIDDLNTKLEKDKLELEKVKQLLENARAQNKPKAILRDIEKQIDEQNLEVLKSTNLIDKYTNMLNELNSYCG